MGYFTFTLANRAEKRTKDGYYFCKSCKLGYDCFAVVVCPDNTQIVEPCYDGYGKFGGRDIYELVTEWNKPYLESIFESIEKRCPEGFYGQSLKPIAVAYQNNDMEVLKKEIEKLPEGSTVRKEWKREIGITISCDGDNNSLLPYPIKIVNAVRHKPYDQLHPSSGCP